MRKLIQCLFCAGYLLYGTACNSPEGKNSTDTNPAKGTKAVSRPVKVPVAEGSRRVLFVGNSHTEYYVSLPDLFGELCDFNKQDMKMEQLVEMGISLKDIYTDYNDKAAAVFSRQDKDGNYYDYVVLQEKTPVAITDAEEYRSSVKQYIREIRKNSPGAVFLIYEVMSPADYDKERADYEQLYGAMKKTAEAVVADNDNAKLYRVSEAITDAYNGKNGYQHLNNATDRIRFGESTLHLLNDGGFLAATLLYTTIFDKAPQVPEKLTLSTGTGDGDMPALQEVSKVVSNTDVLLKIAVDNK